MSLKAIIAVNKHNYIGKDGKLMWKSSEDFKHFRTKTKNAICIIGKRTFEEDLGGKPLKGRQMFIIGEGYNTPIQALKLALHAQAIRIANNVSDAEILRAEEAQPTDIWVLGGATIYNQFLPFIDEFHVSFINDTQIGDVKFEIPPTYRGNIFTYFFDVDKND